MPEQPTIPAACPRCGCRQYTADRSDPSAAILDRVPIVYRGHRVLGDWECLYCGELLVFWTRYAWSLLKARLAPKARGERKDRGPKGKTAR